MPGRRRAGHDDTGTGQPPGETGREGAAAGPLAGAGPLTLGDVEVFRGPIKAGLAAMFAVGLLLLFLNPPSLSGAEGMALIIGGAVVLALGVAGRPSPSPGATPCRSTSSSGSSAGARSWLSIRT